MSAAPPHGDTTAVPLPDKKMPAPCLPPREGQFEFRAMVLAAYGSRCAVTGCEDAEALEAAHIVPFVDQRSHRIENGICLRADIHALYDKGLLRIGQNGVVSVADGVRSKEYRALEGTAVEKPKRVEDAPCSRLLALHERFTG